MTKRRPFVAGNWKLHKTVAEACALARQLKSKLSAAHEAEVAVAPVFTALHAVAEALSASGIAVSGQHVYWEEQGAFTGEVSPALLRDVGCKYCIVGHSERRQYFGDTNETVNQRVHALLGADLKPILCIGETLEQRDAGRTLDVVLGQLEAGLAGVDVAQAPAVVVAYEPVWAIGTGRTASPADAQEVHGAIRARIGGLLGAPVADGMRLLYGGSVKPDNAKTLLAEADIDGALVGGASLNPDSFVAIVEAADQSG